LHQMFEQAYLDYFKIQDEIAERIRILGGYVNFVATERIQALNTNLHDQNTSDKEIIQSAIECHDMNAQLAEECVKTASKYEDLVSEDLCVSLISMYQKFGWMLRSLLSQRS